MPDRKQELKLPITSRNILFEFKLLRWFVLLWVGSLLLWGLILPSNKPLFFPASKVVFVILMIFHAAAYWLILSPGMKKKYVTALLIVQAGIFVVICMVSLQMAIALFLWLTLAGVTILSLSQVRQGILAGLVFFIVGIPAYFYFGKFVDVSTYIWLYIPQTLIPLLAFILFAQQVNAQTRTQNLLDELAVSHRQLEAYAAQVEDLTLTNERQRMARELHDTLAQGLAGIILQLEAIDSRISSGKTEQVQTIIHQAMTRARATLAESRQVIDELRKDTSFIQDDLSSVIKEEVEHFSTSTGIPVTIHLDAEDFVPFPQQDCAYRAVAEALLNIARHAQASQVWVNLIASNGQLMIEIRDNGTGFNSENRIGQVGHYGLLGLRERTRLLGGSLEVNSAPLQGTNIQICLPLETEDEDD